MGARFYNNGQICVGANRVFCHERIHDHFVDQFTARVQALKVGNGLLSDVDCGPLISQAAQDNIMQLVGDAVADGANLVVGGKTLMSPGYFLAPTVLTHVAANMAIRQREIFGPVAAISAFDTLESVVAEANQTPAGLAAYYYTENAKTKHLLAKNLNFGMVGCNTTNIFDSRMGFGGCGESGHGREGGLDALAPYLMEKNFFLA